MKQAYLIIAHNKIEQLKFLVSLLDYENMIFIFYLIRNLELLKIKKDNWNAL